jgi:hypothetical protein
MKRLCAITIAMLALNFLAGCRHGCSDRPRLFDRGRDREGPIERLRDRDDSRGSSRDRECDNCASPMSRTGYPGLGTPVSTTGGMPGGYQMMPGGFPNGFGGATNELPAPMPSMPKIPSQGGSVPEAQPFPVGPGAVLPLPSPATGRNVSK